MASGMTKTQLTRSLAEKLGTNNKTAATFLETLADTAIKETKKNGVFVVPGLGRLVKAHRKARMGRNPQTGEPIQIKAKTVVKFRVAKAAKDAIVERWRQWLVDVELTEASAGTQAELAALLEHRSQFRSTMRIEDPNATDEVAQFRERLLGRLGEMGAVAGLERGEAFKAMRNL